MNTLDGALEWIREHEPQLGESLDGRSDQIEDFLKVENFSYGCKQYFSGSDRWCLVGEAGAFLDPFYSPGSDFIAMSNTLHDRPGHARASTARTSPSARRRTTTSTGAPTASI